MPELPEVELLRRQLEPALVGRTIERVLHSGPSLLFPQPPAELPPLLAGERVLRVERRGKTLCLHCQSLTLWVHLGMTGQLLLRPLPVRPVEDRHAHLLLQLSAPGPHLLLRDPRKFGKVRWSAPDTPPAAVAALGPDALGLTGGVLQARCGGSRAAVKALLLDQHRIAGVGNIYADEALFRARIHPLCPGSALAPDDWKRLARALASVLNESIEAGGSSIDDYRHVDGERGTFQERHRVYGRAGAPCPRCRGTIERIVLAQRGTHFCPRCQPAKG